MESERRQLERRRAGAYFEVRNGENDDMLGMLSDLTVDGMCLHTPLELETGETIPVRIDFAINIQGQSEIACDAVPVWCRMVGMAGCNQAGFKFQNISDSDRGRIEEILSTQKFR